MNPPLNINLLFLVTLIVHLAAGQQSVVPATIRASLLTGGQNQESNSSTSIETKQTTPASAPIITSTSGAADLLISGHEYVDFNERPILLFDGISNESEANGTETPPRSTTVETNSSPTNGIETTTMMTTTTTTTTVSDNSSDVSTMKDDQPGGGGNGNGTEVSEHDVDGDEEDAAELPQAFEPPQNVSQYMDYIERLFHDLRHQITDLFEPHIPQLIRTSQLVQLSSACSYDMLRLALALRQFEPWALRLIDSSGKVPEGIFEGSFTALGSYDECLATQFAAPPISEAQQQQQPKQQQQQQQQSPAQLTQGKYCLVNVSPYLPPKPPADSVERVFQEEANRRNYTQEDQFSRLSPMFYYMKFRIGVCIPSTCQESDLESFSSALSSSLRLNITIPHCQMRREEPMTNYQLAGGLVFACTLALVLGATLMDYSLKVRSREIILLSTSAGADDEGDNAEAKAGQDSQQVPQISAILARRFVGWQGNSNRTGTKRTFGERLSRHWTWMSFSALTNFRLFFAQRHQRRPNQLGADSGELGLQSRPSLQPTMIRCLDGIRVLSLCWVIVANSYVTLDPRATKRLTKTREAPKDFVFQLVAQASLAIETFFFLSGLLVSMSFARKLYPDQHSKGLHSTEAGRAAPAGAKWSRTWQWAQFYIHRYVRMTPATMLVIAFTMFAFRYGDGPLWAEATQRAHASCAQNWWRHLLHVANFIDTRQMCFIHYWYIAADMQLFLFAPLLMLILYKRRRLGYALMGLIGFVSAANLFYTTYARRLPPTLLFYNSDPESRREFGNTIMTKPLTHALPYIVGMLLGKWLLTDRLSSRANNQSSSSSVGALVGSIALAVALAELFLPYKWNNSHLPTRFLASLYAALFRLGWSLVLAYLVISCRHRRGRHCSPQPNINAQPKVDCPRLCCSSPVAPDKPPLAVPFVVLDKRHLEKGLAKNALRAFQCKQSDRLQKKEAAGGEASLGNEFQYYKSLIRNMEPDWCLCGSGGNLVNRLLSLSVFTHLSKLSFVAYLIHLPLMSMFIAQTRGLFAFSHSLVMHLALSYLVMTFLISFILVHIIEFPFLTFERYLFERLFSSTTKTNNVTATTTTTTCSLGGANGNLATVTVSGQANGVSGLELFADKKRESVQQQQNGSTKTTPTTMTLRTGEESSDKVSERL